MEVLSFIMLENIKCSIFSREISSSFTDNLLWLFRAHWKPWKL